MDARRLAATIAAVALTTAAGVLAVVANLGLVRLESPPSHVGGLSPFATEQPAAAGVPAPANAGAASTAPPDTTAPTTSPAKPVEHRHDVRTIRAPETATPSSPSTPAAIPAVTSPPSPPPAASPGDD